MRLFTVLCATLFISNVAFGQTNVVRANAVPGCCGPYVPLVTTPMISLQSVSPNPVGASNATYGLVAGATNSTLSIVNGNTSSEYTQPVWYAGGTTPLISEPAVELPGRGMRMERGERERGEREREHGRAEAKVWTYYGSQEETSSAVEAAASAKTGKHATRTITNQDVEQQNQKNGMVKYDGKTEQIK
jgi:hypothetical protein